MRATVLHLISNRWNSAITEYALSAAKALALLKFENVFVCLEKKAAAHRARSLGYIVEEVPEFSLRQMQLLSDLADRFNPSLIITYGGPEMVLSWVMRNRAGRVIRVRGNLFHPKVFSRPLYRLAHRHIETVIAPSEFVKSKIPTRPKVHVLTIGIDEREFRYITTPVDNSRPEVLIFGRLDPVKGHANFIRLFANLLQDWRDESCPKPVLRIVGREENTKVGELESTAHHSGLVLGEDVIIEATEVTNRAALLSRACVGVVSSLGSELICRVAQEFLMCGTPILVSDVGSLPEVLKEPDFGRVFDHTGAHIRYVKEFIVRSSQLSPGQKKYLSDRAAKYFSLAEMARKMMELLENNYSGTKK